MKLPSVSDYPEKKRESERERERERENSDRSREFTSETIRDIYISLLDDS